MEEVFNLADSDRFSVSQLSSGEVEANPRRLVEPHQELHRKKSYPHAHVPLKIRSARRWSAASSPPRFVATDNGASDGGSMSTANGKNEDCAESPPLLSPSNEPTIEEENFAQNSGQQSRTSPNRSPDDSHGSPVERRVQFDQNKTDEDPSKKRRKSRHHHSHQHRNARKYSLQEEPQWKREGRRVSVQPEDESLAEVDIEELESHRSDDPRGMRRPKATKPISGPYVRIGRKGGNENIRHLLTPSAIRKMYDHSPHAVFVQLDELVGTGEDREWKETARWIKYEEDLEEGSDRWGRPHVASLSFHSLLNLRRCLQSGVVLLDLDEKDLAGVAYRVTEQMVIDELIAEDDKSTVMRSLLMRHKHVNDGEKGFRFNMRKHSSYTSLQSVWEHSGVMGRRSTVAVGRCSVCSASGAASPPRVCRRHSSHVINLSEQERGKQRGIQLDNLESNGSPTTHDNDGSMKIDMKEEIYLTTSQEDLKKFNNETILKRIPEGAEATTVLVGSVGFLSQPTIAFVRLAQGIYMPSITEVTIPVRFMFILLGPTSADLDYHEVGRSISTLMSNRSFHEIAYKAEGRNDLLSAINEFLDDSIVLPPGNWESQALLPFEELKAKSEMIMKRKRDAINKHKLAIEDLKPEIKTKDDFIKPRDDGSKKPPSIDPLQRTRRLFGGLINDIKRRYPLYISDLTNGFNGQCLAASIFMYFAALCSAITFGGLMADKTHNLIGISETLLSTSVTGILFALLSGQPLMVVGTTGPLLLFDQSLFIICGSFNVDFLTLRLYIGIWIAVISAVVACAEGSVLAKQFTRFTEDIFSSLINMIFIMESLVKMHAVYVLHKIMSDYCLPSFTSEALLTNLAYTNTPNNSDSSMLMDDANVLSNSSIHNLSNTKMIHTTTKSLELNNQPNTALFCTCLTLGTFIIAYYLRIFRNSQFLGRSARRALGDFGVPIAIVLMVTLDYLVPEIYTEKLRVPEGLTPSDPDQRDWFISFSGSDDKPFPIWAMFAASVPALMGYIIMFMETHIAELIIDKPERNLRKGSGFHLDIVVVSFLNIICGLIGAPWVCVATVRSLSHVSALTVMSRTHAPGDRPYIIEIKEQRLSALLVSILVGASVSMAFLLSLIPLAVLFGIFLYMGISSLSGIQLFERIILMFMPVKHHPPVAYVKRVPTWKMHMYTIIQVSCLVLLYWVKSTSASLAFPFLLIMLVPLRSQLKYIFSPMELRALDGKQPDLDPEDEPDFYEEAPLPG